MLLQDCCYIVAIYVLYSFRQFENYIIEQYGGIATAQVTNKYYYQIIRPEVAKTGISERVPEYKIIVDQTTYNSLDQSVRSSQSVYDW